MQRKRPLPSEGKTIIVTRSDPRRTGGTYIWRLCQSQLRQRHFANAPADASALMWGENGMVITLTE